MGRLKVYETSGESPVDYIMLKDVTVNDLTLASGTRVRIVIASGDDWVKVYAYRSEEDLLKSIRILVLLMFDDDFPEKQFDQAKFDEELAKVIKKEDKSGNNRQKETKKKKKK